MRLQRQRMSSDDFEALKLIGRGAFGEVAFRHDHETLHRDLCSYPNLWQQLLYHPESIFRNLSVDLCRYLSKKLRSG